MLFRQSLLLSIVVVVVFGQTANRIPPLEITHTAFFEVEIEGTPGFPTVLGNFTIGLFEKVVPKTVANFIMYTNNRVPGKTYLGRTFHRIIKGYIIQGGDLTGDDGDSGFTDSALWFDSENFELKHFGAGWVSMAHGGVKNGKDTNGSQFFITLAPTHGLDGSNVVFGKIISGMPMIRKMENVETDLHDDKPKRKVVIKKCNIVPLKPPLPTTAREGAREDE